MNRILLWVCAVRLLDASCGPVEGASILARDMALEVPAFSSLAPEVEILAAPVAGAQRVVPAPELVRLAHKFNIAAEVVPASACLTVGQSP